VTEIPFPLAGLLGKDMAKILLLVPYLACPGKGIALGRALFGFHLGHNNPLFL
jgi:hypothetical protein